MIPKRVTGLWPLCILVILALVPFAVDPWGLRPFLPPKSILLVVGAAGAAMLASCAWLLATIPSTRRGAGDSSETGRTGAGVGDTFRTPVAGRLDGWIVVPAVLALAWLLIAPMAVAANRALHLLGAVELLAAATLGTLSIIAVRGDERWRNRLLGTVAITAVLMALHALLQAAGLDPLQVLTGVSPQAEGRWRAFTTTGNPNWTGAYLACTAPLVVWLARRRRVGGLEAAVGCVFAGAVLVTGSRLALIALVVGGAYYWRASRKERRAPGQGSRLLAVVAAAAIVAILLVVLVVSGSGLADRWGDTRSIGGRLVSVTAALHLISDSPVFGHGLNHFALQLPYGLRQLHAQVGASWLAWWPRSLSAHVHNDLLETGVDAGTIGMLLLAVFWGLVVYRVRRREPAVAGSLLALAVLAMASVPLQIPTTMLLFGVLAGISAVPPVELREACPDRGLVPREGGAAQRSLRTEESDADGARAAGLESDRSTAMVLAPRVILVLITVAITVITLQHGGRIWRANRMAKLSRALLAAGDLEGAGLAIREVLAATPWDHENGSILAALQVDSGEPSGALATVDSIDAWSASRGSWIVRAQALRALQKEKEAVEVLEAAIAALPDFLRAHFLLGELYASLGMSEESWGAFRRVIDSPQDSPAAAAFKERAGAALERGQ